MSDLLTYFDLSEDEIAQISIPEKFTYPFYYQPDPLARLASEKLQEKITHMNLDHNFGFDEKTGKVIGKMFGVLVVKDYNGELGYLSAFSGKLADSNSHAGFVPPVFDMLVKDGFYREEEEKLNELNRKVDALENDSEIKSLNELKSLKQNEIDHCKSNFKQVYKKAKERRARLRLEGKEKMNEADYNEFLNDLKQESMTESRSHKREIETLKTELAQLEESILSHSKKVEALKLARKQKSREVQKALFDQYSFLNIGGQSKSLWQIFYSDLGTIPPSGAGECALPKLLHYAFQNDMTPLCMAEFWWGNAPKGKIRQHLNYYPACKSKCQPILSHMLNGMEVEKNPLEYQIDNTNDLEIIYEDSDLLAVNKPSGLLSVPGKKIEKSIYTWAKEKYPNATGPLIVHRLDMSTSGILLIAKTKNAHKSLQQQFENRTVQKRYVALLDGELTLEEGKIDLPIILDYDNRPQQMVCYERGKKAITYFKKLELKAGKTRIHFFPHTGRTHQLRVHAASEEGLGIPIVGDDIYGSIDDRLCLHAEGLEFIHPTSGKKMRLKVRADF